MSSEHNNQNCNSVSEVAPPACAAVTPTEENGHAEESLKNGVGSEGSISSSNSASPQQSNRVSSPVSRQSVSHRSSSPISFSSNNAGHSPRSGSPQPGSSGNSPPSHQHVVHVHVNPGETFSVRLGDQIQHIQGPATVRMVSNNGPPLPMPMQVPPGHMVQQIVDEYGILTHVILSPQPPVPGTPMTGGPNSASQYYPNAPYSPHYTTQAHYPSHPPHHHPPHNVPPHMHSGIPPPQHNHCNTHGPLHSSAPSPPVNSSEDRTLRQRAKVRKKLQQRRNDGYYHQQQQQQSRPPGRRRVPPGVNGETPANSVSNMVPSENGPAEVEEDNSILIQCLSNMLPPKITDIESRSALIQISPPEVETPDLDLDPADFKYELLLSDKGRDTKYKPVYKGDATEITLKDLKPATEYHLRVCTILNDTIKGNQTASVSFRTACCQPDAPSFPKLMSKTRNNIQLKWASTCENGCKISSYTLESDQGNGEFVEIYNGLQRQFRHSKLQASTRYSFRLAAINSVGKSQFSEPASFFTNGSIPTEPDPPMLSEPFIYNLTVSWIKRPNDDEFLLQMEDEASGLGFLSAYHGPSLSSTVRKLRRNTEYKFRLAAKNDEGQSKWSDCVLYRTLPDRPTAPPKPQIKGKIVAHSFKVIWDAPTDTGGSEITKFVLELDDGEGYHIVYEGSEREHVFDQLVPGHTYRVRVACYSLAGRSEFSDCCVTSTQPVVPGQCNSPKLQGKPKATSLHLRWSYPKYDGGSSVNLYAAQMITPDNSTREVYRGHDLDCIVAGLAPGRSYLFQVRAFNRTGGGPWSDPMDVVSGAGIPDASRAVQVNCKSAHCAAISWDEPVNNGATITDYRLEWRHKPDSSEYTQIYLGPSLSHEVKGLTPDTQYSFRVQAMNSTGTGPFSACVSCLTPPSSPASIMAIKSSVTATTILLTWHEPHNNGSEIISYNIDMGEHNTIMVEPVTEYEISDLRPEVTYKIRIQAVNAIGVGAFSGPVKVTTKCLPPNPPKMECVAAAPNSLKLKWGNGRNLDMVTYNLEMEKEDGSFQRVYSGPAHNHKVNRLHELSNYEFRIYACNEAGQGPYSDTYTISTIKAAPSSVPVPSVNKITLTSCLVEWQSVRQVGTDAIAYLLQLQKIDSRDREYKEIYRGPSTQFAIENLQPRSDYYVRVCAIRQCDSGMGDILGPYSQGRTFSTLSPPAPMKQTVNRSENSGRSSEPKPLSDQQWAAIIFVGFVLVAFLIAFITQQVLSVGEDASR